VTPGNARTEHPRRIPGARLKAPLSHADGVRITDANGSTGDVAHWCYAGVIATTISQRDLRNDSGVIMRRVEQGESFTVTRNGTPVADLVPHDVGAVGRRARFVPVEAIASGVAALPPWGTREFADELHDLDVTVDDRDVDRWNAR
jgi:prevent-host-death family protein